MAVGDVIINAATNSSNDTVTIVTDSRSVIQVVASINNRDPLVQAQREKLHTCRKQVTLCWVPAHVGVPRDEKVDEAAEAAVTDLEVSSTGLLASDIKIL